MILYKNGVDIEALWKEILSCFLNHSCDEHRTTETDKDYNKCVHPCSVTSIVCFFATLWTIYSTPVSAVHGIL